MPDSITEIGYGAFYNCTLLKNINIPKGVKVINERTFEHCLSLRKLSIPSNIETITDGYAEKIYEGINSYYFEYHGTFPRYLEEIIFENGI